MPKYAASGQLGQ